MLGYILLFTFWITKALDSENSCKKQEEKLFLVPVDYHSMTKKLSMTRRKHKPAYTGTSKCYNLSCPSVVLKEDVIFAPCAIIAIMVKLYKQICNTD